MNRFRLCTDLSGLSHGTLDPRPVKWIVALEVIMAEPAFTNVLGTNATQDATTITISKVDLEAVGLTPADLNTGESILTAIILLARKQLTQENYNNNIDQSIYLEDGFSSFTTRGNDNDSYRVDQITVNFSKLDASSIIDPDNY